MSTVAGGGGAWSRRPGVLLAGILVAAAVLRLYRLGENPPGLYCDEAAIAVNARSIGLTGRNLGGDLLPLYCKERSYEFWGVTGILYQPVYLYASVPFATLLGTSPAAARLPSVFFGLAGIVGAFILGRRLFEARTGLVAAALLAISPWHVQFSRIAFEAIALPVLLSFGAACLWRGLEARRWLVTGAALLGLATYAYPVAKLFVPLLLAVFVAIHFRTLRGRWKDALVALSIMALIVAPNLWLVLTGTHQERVYEKLIFTAHLEGERAVEFLRERGAEWILARRGLLVPFVFLYNYVTYFGPGYLFFDGDPNVRHSPPGVGVCLMVTAPLLVAGAIALARRWREPRSRFVLAWVLLYPIAASLTVENPHAIRSITAIPVLDLLAAVGLLALLDVSRLTGEDPEPRPWKARLGMGVLLGAALAAPLEYLSYLERFHRNYPRQSASAWQAGIREALTFCTEERRGGQVWLSPGVHNGYLFILASGSIDLRALDRSRDVNGQLRPFGYTIGPPVSPGPRDLWILHSDERGRLPLAWDALREITYPDGSPNLVVMRSPAR